MKLGFHALALILGLGLVAPSFAQEEPKKEEPAKEEAAKPTEEAAPAAEPAKEEAAKPTEEAAPAAEPAKKEEAAKPAEKAAPVAVPAAAPAAAPAKELSSCAKSFVPLADSYKAAYDDMQKWIGEIDAQTAAASDKAQKLQAQIQQNETAITQAKLDKNDSKAKSLQKENKKLWDDFNASKKELQTLCSSFSKQVSERVKQYADASGKALEGLKSQTK
jgi:outer membrane biosynthesis protein TonB